MDAEEIKALRAEVAALRQELTMLRAELLALRRIPVAPAPYAPTFPPAVPMPGSPFAPLPTSAPLRPWYEITCNKPHSEC